jgi:hypothetical protein
VAPVVVAQCRLTATQHNPEVQASLVRDFLAVQAPSEAQREGFPQVVVVVQVAREEMHR